MSHNAFPYNTLTTEWDTHTQRSVTRINGTMPGMSTREFYLAHILGGIASNPATMMDPEAHVKYAVKLAMLAADEAIKQCL